MRWLVLWFDIKIGLGEILSSILFKYWVVVVVVVGEGGCVKKKKKLELKYTLRIPGSQRGIESTQTKRSYQQQKKHRRSKK